MTKIKYNLADLKLGSDIPTTYTSPTTGEELAMPCSEDESAVMKGPEWRGPLWWRGAGFADLAINFSRIDGCPIADPSHAVARNVELFLASIRQKQDNDPQQYKQLLAQIFAGDAAYYAWDMFLLVKEQHPEPQLLWKAIFEVTGKEMVLRCLRNNGVDFAMLSAIGNFMGGQWMREVFWPTPLTPDPVFNAVNVLWTSGLEVWMRCTMQHHMPVSMTCAYGTMLHIWAANEEPGYVKAVLSTFASRAPGHVDLTVQDYEGKTLLLLACKAGQGGLVKHLLDCWTNIGLNTPDKMGRTPLMLAAICCDRTVVEKLLAKGADRTLKDQDGHDFNYYATLASLDLAAANELTARVMREIHREPGRSCKAHKNYVRDLDRAGIPLLLGDKPVLRSLRAGEDAERLLGALGLLVKVAPEQLWFFEAQIRGEDPISAGDLTLLEASIAAQLATASWIASQAKPGHKPRDAGVAPQRVNSLLLGNSQHH